MHAHTHIHITYGEISFRRGGWKRNGREEISNGKTRKKEAKVIREGQMGFEYYIIL